MRTSTFAYERGKSTVTCGFAPSSECEGTGGPRHHAIRRNVAAEKNQNSCQHEQRPVLASPLVFRRLDRMKALRSNGRAYNWHPVRESLGIRSFLPRQEFTYFLQQCRELYANPQFRRPSY